MSFVPTRVPVSPRKPGTVAVTIGETCLRGTAVDLRGWDVDTEAVVDAVRAASAVGPRPRRSARPTVRVDCEPAGPVHAHLCRLPPRSLDLHDALVAAARSRESVPPSTSRLERARRDLAAAEQTVDAPELTPAKRRVADTAERTRRLDERVATLRGRLQAARELGGDTSAIEADLADAMAELTESETERIAAEQRLTQVERATRSARDARQRRLRLADRVANLRRLVRRELVESVYDDFRTAVETLPVDADVADAGESPSEYRGDPTAAALAVARVARLDAPLVLLDSPFGSPAEAATRLDAPVLHL